MVHGHVGRCCLIAMIQLFYKYTFLDKKCDHSLILALSLHVLLAKRQRQETRKHKNENKIIEPYKLREEIS